MLWVMEMWSGLTSIACVCVCVDEDDTSSWLYGTQEQPAKEGRKQGSAEEKLSF